MSQYGNPPIKIETPDVLERIKTAESDIQQFAMGTFDSSFYIDLLFNFPNKKSSLNAKEDKDGKVLLWSMQLYPILSQKEQ